MSAVGAATAEPGSSTAAGDSTSMSTQEGVGGGAESHEGTREVEAVDGSTGGGVPVFKPALVYTKQGDVVHGSPEGMMTWPPLRQRSMWSTTPLTLTSACECRGGCFCFSSLLLCLRK